MHTVLPALCTGCELCVPPCPVDCIAILPAGRVWGSEDARGARERYEVRSERIARVKARTAPRVSPDRERQRRQDAVTAARARARARRAAFGGGLK